MTHFEKLFSKSSKIFFDTAPIIYYIEAHPVYGNLVKSIMLNFSRRYIFASTSVITLAEVLVVPCKMKSKNLIEKFSTFIRYGYNLELIDI